MASDRDESLHLDGGGQLCCHVCLLCLGVTKSAAFAGTTGNHGRRVCGDGIACCPGTERNHGYGELGWLAGGLSRVIFTVFGQNLAKKPFWSIQVNLRGQADEASPTLGHTDLMSSEATDKSNMAVNSDATPACPVTVILVNWHSEALLAQALSGLCRQSRTPEQVIVVDNGSSVDLPLHAYLAGPIDVLRMPGNAGFAAANNLAIQSVATTKWVALLNPDAIPEENWLEKLLAAAGRHPDVAVFASKQLMADNPQTIDGLGDIYHVSGAAWRDGYGQSLTQRPMAGDQPVFAACAAAALYRRDAVLEAGGFDEDFFCYFEDVDLGFRLNLLGYKTMLVPDALVYHFGSATSGGGKSDFSVHHGHRNLVWTYVKNMPAALFWRYLPHHLMFNLLSIVYFVARGQGKVILRAKWQALLGIPAMLRKRKHIQQSRRVRSHQLRLQMLTGWLKPYGRNRHIEEVKFNG